MITAQPLWLRSFSECAGVLFYGEEYKQELMELKNSVRIIRSNRKTISLQIDPDLTMTLRVPMRMSAGDIDRFLKEKEPWIRKHLERQRQKMEERDHAKKPPLRAEEIRALADQALDYIPGRAAYFAPIVGVTYGRITIRNQKTRWGSCSTKGNLNFNCLLMLTPPEVIDYVVVHELCHRKEMNHSKRFWDEVERVLPDHKNARKWLKENGGAIISRMC